MRKDFIISAPKVAVGGTSFVGPWQTLVKFPATIPIPRPNGIGEDLTGASAKSDPNPLGIALAPHKRPQFVQFNDIMAAGRKNRAFERSQRLSFFLTNSKRCWDSPRRRAVNRVDCCVPDRLEGSFLFALRCISLWGFAALFTTIMAAVALFMVGRLAKFNDIFTSTVPTINNFSNHALKINCLTLFVQLKIQNNILFLYTTDFKGGEVTSDAGLLLIREVDRRLGLTEQAARQLVDKRQKGKVRHEMLAMIRQRVYGLVAGYEDLNDFDTLRRDPLLQTVTGRTEALASAPTLCRFENGQDRRAAFALNELLVEQFMGSFAEEPEEIILDFDATDNPVHGLQEGRFFHGYYDHYCFLPLYVFCGDQLLVAYLRPSKIDASKHAGAILKLLVKRIRQSWPHTRIIWRADSGFCRDRILSWCERNEVYFIVGTARHARLQQAARQLQEQAKQWFEGSGKKQRLFQHFEYGAKSWRRQRLIIHKAEHTAQGSNPRFVVTNLQGDPQELYDKVYCGRGEMENRIKEQMQLFSERTSAHKWWANQWRLLLSGLAYTLMEALRRFALKGTKWARLQCHSLRLKLIKIGAVIVRNTRTIHFHLSESYPWASLFNHAARRLVPT